MRHISFFALTAALAIGTLLMLQRLRPEVLLVGNVTIDIVDGNRTVGGAISYASAVLEAQGKRACVVTTAGPDADLSIFKNHDLHIVPDKESLTFVHTYTWWGHKRVLHVTGRPSITLDLHHVPLQCRLAKTVLIMPLLPTDVYSPSFVKWRNIQNRLLPQQIGLAAQGFQRDTAADGKVFAYNAPHPLLLKSLGEGVSVFLSDVESDPWSKEDLAKVVSSSDRLLITRGDKGATEFVEGYSQMDINATKVDKVIDTNGAGDTFATAYMLALAAQSPNPGWDASRAAAVLITKPQRCKPWCIASEQAAFRFLTVRKEKQSHRWWAVYPQDWMSFPVLGQYFAPSVINKATDP